LAYSQYGKPDQLALLKSYLKTCLLQHPDFRLGTVMATSKVNMKYAAEIISPGGAIAVLEVRQGLLDDVQKGKESELQALVDEIVLEKFPDEVD